MTTLADLKTKIEKDAAKRDSMNGPRRSYLKVDPGESKRVRFRQELVSDGENYDEDRDTAAILRVHQAPSNFRVKALCTKDSEENEFHCFACERVMDGEKGFRSRERLLINVLALDDGDWEPFVFEQAWVGNSNIGQLLAEFTGEYGTLTDRDYKITRIGKGLDTKYSIIPLKEGDTPAEDEEAEFFTVHDAVRTVPYEQQEDFYLENESDDSGSNDSWGS